MEQNSEIQRMRRDTDPLWMCPKCLRSGGCRFPKHLDVYSGAVAIREAHRAVSPDCDSDVRIFNPEDWLNLAAVPELLEALKAFEDAASSWHEMHHDNPTTQCDDLCVCIPGAVIAIAKAEGR